MPTEEEFLAALKRAMPDFDWDNLPTEDLPWGQSWGEQAGMDGEDPYSHLALERDPARVTDKSLIPVLQGWAVPSTLMNINDGVTGATGQHYRPNKTVYSGNITDFLTYGRCGLPSANYAACLLPFTGSNKTVSVFFDAASCSSDTTLTNVFKNGFIDAMATLQIDTGWSFPIAATASSARVVVKCASGANLTAMNASPKAMGIMTISGGIQAYNVFPNHFGEDCGGLNFDSLTDAHYTYTNGVLYINWSSWLNDFASHCAGSTSTDFRQNSANVLVQHEMLHWLGFTHEFDSNNYPVFQNVMFNELGCSAGDPHPLTQLDDTRNEITTALRNRNTTPTSQQTLNFNGISCLVPLEETQSKTQDHAPFADGKNMGGIAAWTNNFIYGVRTDPTHSRCDWGSTTQECAVPGQYELPYCFDTSASNTLKNQVHALNLAGRNLGMFTFPERSSCSDPSVKIKFQEGTCSGNNTHMDGIVCATFPLATFGNGLTMIDGTGFQPPGSFLSWTSDGGKMNIKIDRADVNTFPTSPVNQRLMMEQRALMLAVHWAMGVGSITHSDQYEFSRSTFPVLKNGSTQPWSPGLKCTFERFQANGDRQIYFPGSSSGGYCGAAD